MKPCEWCKKPFQPKRHGQRFCDRSCSLKWIHQSPIRNAKLSAVHRKWWQSSQGEKTRAETSARMKASNPMHNPATYRKAVASIRASGVQPIIRGGNGTGPTKAEWQLMRMFPEGVWNYGIRTGKWNGSGIPPVYKVDLGFPSIKLAIEADGPSHNTPVRRAKDRKKEAFLKGIGWTVLRYSNRAILDFRTQVTILADVEFLISRLPVTPPTA